MYLSQLVDYLISLLGSYSPSGFLPVNVIIHGLLLLELVSMLIHALDANIVFTCNSSFFMRRSHLSIYLFTFSCCYFFCIINYTSLRM